MSEDKHPKVSAQEWVHKATENLWVDYTKAMEEDKHDSFESQFSASMEFLFSRISVLLFMIYMKHPEIIEELDPEGVNHEPVEPTVPPTEKDKEKLH